MSRMFARLVRMWKLAALPAAIFGTASAAQAQHECSDCGNGHCPPAFKHIAEKGPRIHVRRGCAKPVCDPCTLPKWGYYATCWSQWPHGNDLSHCRPTAGMVIESNVAVPAPVTPPVAAPMAPLAPMPPQAPQAAPPAPRNPPPGARPLRPGL